MSISVEPRPRGVRLRRVQHPLRQSHPTVFVLWIPTP
ncbi:hypothetical protein M2163_000240 [Streptomyces sp. SAI-135]|nr:hypothetical protein [Streptomyces sp. SAI-090]MDH6574138.1 hypothetical protein [Streptomyces sp. SAI-117]MDH6581126.1 hypothetical protein [Streptomyces sp. SAI-133]MDH6613132.1 hypothetical protein [Streptomyces sp. SAI-135]